MKICFLTGQLSNGGAERVISVIASKLAEQGKDVWLYVFARCENEYKVSPKVKLESMCNSQDEYEKLGIYFRLSKLRKYLKRVRPEIAVGFLQAGYAMYIASFGMNIKRVASVRVAPEKMEEYAYGLRKKLEQRWFSNADAVVIQCEEQRKYGEQRNWKNISVIGNPLGENIQSIPKHLHRERCQDIVMAGRLEEQKNYEMAIKAIAYLSKEGLAFTLHIYGTGSKREELEELAGKLGVKSQVIFHGWSKNVVEEYRKYDIYLMTSDFEGMPNSLMEAMANGMLCVSTECPTGPKDLLEDKKEGFLIPPGEEHLLAETLKNIRNMPKSERELIGEKARNKILCHYNEEKIAKCWEALFLQLVERRI